MLSKLVAFDTNVYMGNNSKDPKVIMQVLRAWSLITPSIVILVPIVSFPICLVCCPIDCRSLSWRICYFRVLQRNCHVVVTSAFKEGIQNPL